MTTDHSILEQALSDADPGRTPRDAAPDARALAMRDRILRETAAPKKRRRMRALGWATGLVAVATAAVVAFVMITPQVAAVAGTPSPLDFEGESTVTGIVDEASTALDSSPGPAEPLRLVRTASWGISVDVGTETSTVVPQLSTLSWQPDGSGHMTIIEGVPYDPTDAVASNAAEVRSSGEVVADFDITPEQFSSPWLSVPGESADDMVAILRAFGMPEQPTAFDVQTAMTWVLGQWTLTNAQHRELLVLLEDAGGGDALGTSTDRLGRPVTGIRTLSPDGAVSDLVLVSLDTGRIVGVERTVLKADEVYPAGAIVSYSLWDVEEELIR
ncbi:hypothetical protein [Microbacterium sp. SA39]|uniref:hypothetical protein n=1 Tax=Microbacterium sp. SA39 TaxID=1263625 RepID=UPI0005FA5C7C|nr:hypothetical protein [Microbacterium sp. SA39]KJQ55542.1 hypothetical protein RS85_00605 [Microbacterium sp. SA39]